MRKAILVVSSLFFLLPVVPAEIESQTIELQGQASGWVTVSGDESSPAQVGLRYIPSLFVSKSITGKYSFDAEFSLNAYGTGLIHELNKIDSDGKTKPHRLWLRFSGSQFEARFGLQKINFGSASLLRPLMWFDRLDPRDPLQLTDGVYGLLLRYYFLNNANVWLWGLSGNDDPKGWEAVPSDNKSVEYGGRLQYPLLTGEIGFTYHHREMDLEKGLNALISTVTGPTPQDFLTQVGIDDVPGPENRFGLDGKWDAEAGVWFEGVLIHQDVDFLPAKYQRLINIGCDYTLGLGNGLHVLSEYFVREASDEVFGSGEGIEFSVLSLNYPVGLVDNLTGILYYDWANSDWYRFINWQRTYDNWDVHLIGFWNPDQFQMYQSREETNTFAGIGFQLMVVFDY